MFEQRAEFMVGVNVLVLRDRMLLLGKRKNTTGDGAWGLPGGHLETGDVMTDTAVRELLEETGLNAEKFKFKNIINNPEQNSQHYIQVGFFAEGVRGEPELKEPDRCAEWRWFAANALPSEIFLPHRKQIELFIAGKEKYGEQRI